MSPTLATHSSAHCSTHHTDKDYLLVQGVNSALVLGTGASALEPHTPTRHTLPQVVNAAHTDVLQAMLDAADDVGHELEHAAPVTHSSRDALGHLDRVWAIAEIDW